MQSAEEHVHGVLYMDVQGRSLAPKTTADFSVSSDSCEFMWQTAGPEGGRLLVWNTHKTWE